LNQRKRLLIYSVLAVLSVGTVSAAEEWVLFVNSSPPAAEVFLNGELLADTTPLIIRSQVAGPNLIAITRGGYEPYTVELDLAPGVATELSPKLVPSGISLSLPRNETATVAGNTVTAGDSVIQLNEQQVLVTADGGLISVEPSPRLQRFADGLSIAVPVALGFGVLLTADAAMNPPAEGPVFPPTVIAVQGVTAGLILADIFVYVAKRVRQRDFRVAVEDRGDPAREQDILREGDDRLARGDLAFALESYDDLIREFPSSELVPAALHRSAGVQILFGETNDAELRFLRIVDELPVAEFYDSSLKNLADLAVRDGAYRAGLEYLSRIVYFKAPFSRAEILDYAREITAAWALVNPTAIEEASELLPALSE